MATSPLVPGRLPVAIEDHAYQIEPSGFRRETVPVLRQQADTSTEPGEMSLNPQGLWRRSQESWHHGAGQEFLDGRSEEAADPHRFRSSKGVDVWTRGQVSLLHPSLKVLSTSNTNLFLATATGGGFPFLYVADGTGLWFNSLPFGLLNTIALQLGTGWTPTNATIAASPPTGNPNWMRVTASGAGTVSIASPTGTSGMPVEGGRLYSFILGSKWMGGGGGGRIGRITAHWYTAAGALISSDTLTAANIDDPNQSTSTQVTAPATAAFASLTVTWTTAWVVGERHDVAANLGPGDAVGGLVGPDIWTSCEINAGQPAQTVQSIASDGSNVWAALGTSGLHLTGAGGSTSTADVPAAPASGQISLVGYANGFLLAAGSAGVSSSRQNSLWVVNNPLEPAPTLSLIKTHPNTSFVWTGISPGRSCVYAFGNSGSNGEVYKITFDPNTGALSSAASFATYLPDGETIHALQFYAGGIIMGTGKGIRLGQADGAGNIDYGPLIDTEWPVRCIEPQGRWCWFGWTKYDASYSGLGRVDLGFFTDNLTPAWASDLMTADTSTGDTVACVTFTPYGYAATQRPPIRVFTVAGEGVYSEDPYSRVDSGTLDTGTIRFATSEPKTARSVDIRHHALPAGGTVAASQQIDDNGTFTALGTSSTTSSYGPAAPLDAGSVSAEAFEYRLTLTRPTASGTDFTRSPELTRWTAKVLPTPSTIDEVFTIPIILRREVIDNNDANYTYPNGVAAEVTYLKGLERTRTLINLQLGTESHTCYIAASQLEGANWGPGKAYMECIYTIQAQTVRG